MSPKSRDDATRAEKLIASLRRRRPSKLESERQFFTELTAAFPGYLSTKFAKETRYEELMCVGYHPQRQRLEAVVSIKQDTGYEGDICADGSPEYVRFFVDWNNDGTWTDVGLASFRAHDIPGDKPLEYAVGPRIDPHERWCLFENLPKVRAILSWNQVPTPGDESFDPTWGNVVESQIQIDAFRVFSLRDVFELTEIDITPQLEAAFDLDTEIDAKATQPLSLGALKKLYADTDVPPHRFAFPQLTKALALPGGAGPG